MTAGYQSPDILHSTDGAEIDDEGHVDVTMAPPEDVQRNQMEPVPLPSPGKGEGNEIRVQKSSNVWYFMMGELLISRAHDSTPKFTSSTHCSHRIFALNAPW